MTIKSIDSQIRILTHVYTQLSRGVQTDFNQALRFAIGEFVGSHRSVVGNTHYKWRDACLREVRKVKGFRSYLELDKWLTESGRKSEEVEDLVYAAIENLGLKRVA